MNQHYDYKKALAIFAIDSRPHIAASHLTIAEYIFSEAKFHGIEDSLVPYKQWILDTFDYKASSPFAIIRLWNTARRTGANIPLMRHIKSHMATIVVFALHRS